MGTQTAIAHKIVENGGDYILSVKGNQGSLEEEVHATCNRNTPVFDICDVEKGHGRIETRRCEVFEKGLTVDESRWKKLTSIIKNTSTREFASGKKEIQERYYISSLGTAEDFNRFIRLHCGIENRQHWTLDMIFREDEQRKRAKHAAANFAIVRNNWTQPAKKRHGKRIITV